MDSWHSGLGILFMFFPSPLVLTHCESYLFVLTLAHYVKWSEVFNEGFDILMNTIQGFICPLY